MNRWQATLFDELHAMASPQQCADRVAWACTELGFDHFTYGAWAALPLSNPALDCIGNTPAAWQQRYRQQRHVACDPVVLHASRSREPLAWTADIFAPYPVLADDAHAHGLCIGWTLASINAKGRRGLLTLTRRAPAFSEDERRQKTQDLRWLAYTAHLFLADDAARRVDRQAVQELTKREAEVLRWTGDGKTTGEISTILSISDNTVNYYLKNAMYKLQASNKTSAVVIALTQGLLTPPP